MQPTTCAPSLRRARIRLAEQAGRIRPRLEVLRRNALGATGIGNGKVVVNRAMSLDGFIAGPGDAMDWGGGRHPGDIIPPEITAEVAAATGAMLVGRRTWDVGDKMEADDPGSVDYPFSGPMFLLTHRPPDPPLPDVTILSGDIGEVVASALDAAGGKDLEILGADVASQCLQRGLVDEILVYVLPVLLGDGVRFTPPGIGRIDLEPMSSTQSGEVTILRFRVRR
jgi:dihydrofolate reductase